jgi:hypothetical protein
VKSRRRRSATPDPRFLITGSGSAPVPLVDPPVPRGLPDDLIGEAAQRLGIMSLVIAGLLVVELLLVHFLLTLPGALTAADLGKLSRWLPVFDVIAPLAVGVSLGLFWYTRNGRGSPTTSARPGAGVAKSSWPPRWDC